jgi:streptomycin 6-kinase
VVLKISAPWNQSAPGAERNALQVWNGQGAVKLLECNQPGNVLLLERLDPGSPMSYQLDDTQACQHIADLHQQLILVDAPPDFPDALEQTRRHQKLARISWSSKGLHDIISRQHLMAFEEFVLKWCQGGKASVVHGDFQNKNILLHGKQLLVIDPAPALADPLMDLANWLLIFNPNQGVERRAKILAKLLDLDLERLMIWVRIQATYSVIFSMPENRQAYLPYCLYSKDILGLS